MNATLLPLPAGHRRILAVLVAASLTTAWQDKGYIAHDRLAGVVDPTGDAAALVAGAPDMAGPMGRELLNNLTTGQARCCRPTA